MNWIRKNSKFLYIWFLLNIIMYLVISSGNIAIISLIILVWYISENYLWNKVNNNSNDHYYIKYFTFILFLVISILYLYDLYTPGGLGVAMLELVVPPLLILYLLLRIFLFKNKWTFNLYKKIVRFLDSKYIWIEILEYLLIFFVVIFIAGQHYNIFYSDNPKFFEECVKSNDINRCNSLGKLKKNCYMTFFNNNIKYKDINLFKEYKKKNDQYCGRNRFCSEVLWKFWLRNLKKYISKKIDADINLNNISIYDDRIVIKKEKIFRANNYKKDVQMDYKSTAKEISNKFSFYSDEILDYGYVLHSINGWFNMVVSYDDRILIKATLYKETYLNKEELDKRINFINKVINFVNKDDSIIYH